MPYIPQAERDAAAENPFYGRGNPGILNYRITQVLIDWLGREPLYADFDAAIGALECAKFELYRRSLSPHEDKAIARNGDIYPEHLLPHPVADVKVDEPESEEEDALATRLGRTERRYI